MHKSIQILLILVTDCIDSAIQSCGSICVVIEFCFIPKELIKFLLKEGQLILSFAI